MSPNTFSSQLVRRLRIRGTDNDEAEAADSNNNNTVNDEGSDSGPSTSGIASLRGQALKSINDNLLTPLRPILKRKVRATHKCEFLRNCVARNFLPKGVLPRVPIKIEDPPSSLKEKWNTTLQECGNKLLRLLIDFHRGQISEFEELAQDSILRGSQIILPEFITSMPSITETIEHEIEQLICETSLTGKRSNNHTAKKRKLDKAKKPPSPKRPKHDAKNTSSPSTMEGQSKKHPWRPLKLKKKGKSTERPVRDI